MVAVTIWNEFRHEREDDAVAAVYPDGIHETIADALADDHEVRTATLDEPDHGLTDEVLESTDVLLWWGHEAHDEVSDAVVDRVCERVLEGMGFIPLHSSHYAKPFKRLMGTACSLQYREDGGTERLWVVDPGHPIADGLDEAIELPKTEMYGEPFDVPEPDRQVFVSWFEGARCSAAAAVTGAETDGYSTSDRVTKRIRSMRTRRFGGSFGTRSPGPARPRARRGRSESGSSTAPGSTAPESRRQFDDYLEIDAGRRLEAVAHVVGEVVREPSPGGRST